MTMQILNADYWSSYLQPYVADLGVALVFGVGYYLFKGLKNEKNSEDFNSKLKERIKTGLNKWSEAKTIQKFNALITSNEDKAVDAFKILNSMQKSGINPDIVTYNCLLDMSYKLDQGEQAVKIFEEISDFTSPVSPDVVTYNILLKGIVNSIKDYQGNNTNNNIVKGFKTEMVNKVKNILKDMKNRNISLNDITYNTAIDCAVEAGDFNFAWSLYEEMKNDSAIRPDLYTFATLIKGLKNSYTNCEEKTLLNRAVEILNKVKSGDFENLRADEVLYNSVLDTCVKFGEIKLAEEIFHEMKSCMNPSLITYSIMIKGYGASYNIEKVSEIFQELKLLNANIKPNDIIYGCLLNAAVKCNRCDLMNEFYQEMKLQKIKENHIIYTTLIKGFNKFKKFDQAFNIYDNITETEKMNTNIVIYNAILDVCVESKNFNKLNEIYLFIKKHAEENDNFPQPNVITYSTVIKGFAKCGKSAEARKIYQFLKENAYQLDEVLFNTVTDAFARANDVEQAFQVLNDMKACGVARSSVIYSILMKMFSNQGDEKNCLKVLSEMKAEGLKPSLVTYTTLMQMYIKKKKISQAVSVYEELKSISSIKIDQVTYNFIINGCSFNQKLEIAIEILLESLQQGVKLSDETYNNVLEYLLNNKFMKYPDRCNNASRILKALKERNFNLNNDMYQKVMKLLYNNTTQNKKVESSICENFKNFNNLREVSIKDENSSYFSNNRQKENLHKHRKHNYK
jgi:pentatricopeptide repeat protein